MKRVAAAALLIIAAGCRTVPPPQPKPSDVLSGTASWYGQEFAGRATANGEIFDPMQLTAAHRTLPFGTLLDVKNVKNGETVRVRVNDRGPFIADRVLDLSYAAALKIGLVEPGTGDVQMTVVRLGQGEREPPVPYIVTVPEVKATADAPAATVDAVPVVADVPQIAPPQQPEVRRQVSPDGKRIVESTSAPLTPAPPTLSPRSGARVSNKYIVQVGAFAQEMNAKLLQDQLSQLGQTAYIDHADLFRVRIGPFGTRDEAVRTRTTLETAGLSAIIVAQ